MYCVGLLFIGISLAPNSFAVFFGILPWDVKEYIFPCCAFSMAWQNHIGYLTTIRALVGSNSA